MKIHKVGGEKKGLRGMGIRLFSGIKAAFWTTFLGSPVIWDEYVRPYMLIVWIYSLS